MALNISRQTIEAEQVASAKSVQTLARAEALVPGAGREAIEVLLSDARASLEPAQAQADRVIVEGTIYCQAAYRQGDAETLRAVAAQARISQIFEMPGVAAGMGAEACAVVEHVETRYENGRMVFYVTLSLSASAIKLTPIEVITAIDGDAAVETRYAEVCSVKTVAASDARQLVREQFPLSAALDARTTLMEWGAARAISAEADLGGVRVKGEIYVEALISSGVEGRPAALIKQTLPFDQLVEVPEWLARDVCAEAALQSLSARVEQGGESEDSTLTIEAEVAIRVDSLARDCVSALSDAYSTTGAQIEAETQSVTACAEYACVSSVESVRGTLLLGENAPGVGTVLAVLARPNVSGWATDGASSIDGVIEVSVLYLPGGASGAASAQAELPFSIKTQGALNDSSIVCLNVLTAEANPLMSDRLDIRLNIEARAKTRFCEDIEIVSGAQYGAAIDKKPGIIIYWPDEADSVWSIGKRYSVPETGVLSALAPAEVPAPGKSVILKI